jgi:RNA polymerase Rpb4
MELGDLEESETPEDEPSLLLSNIEMLEHLQKNLAENLSTQRRWKDRDWVQAQVVQYLQSTPCTRLDPSRRREFQSLLESRKRRAVKSSLSPAKPNPDPVFPTSPSPLKVPSAEPPFPDLAPSSGGNLQPDLNGIPARDSVSTASLKAAAASTSARDESGDESPYDGDEAIATGFGLARSEALQILNFMPSEAVELHLMIDDLDSRFSTKQQDGLLDAISRYTRTTAPVGEKACVTANAAAATEGAASAEERGEARVAGKVSGDGQMNGL